MNRSRLHRRTWDAAIRAVQECLTEWPTVVPVTSEEQKTLNAVSRLCERLRARHRLIAVPTDDALAAKYAISPRTVRNWRKAGCPFERGQRRVLDWLARQRYAPAGAEAKFKAQLASRRWRLTHPVRDVLGEFRTQILGLRAQYQAAGIEPPDWVRRMPFRAR